MDEQLLAALDKIDLGKLFATPTVQERMARVVNRLSQHQDNFRSSVRSNLMAMLIEIWQNPDGLTPQQVFDLIGPRGATVLQVMEIFWPMLVKSFPESETKSPRPDGVVLVVNADGTVTVK
jgi:hypothetical protein